MPRSGSAALHRDAERSAAVSEWGSIYKELGARTVINATGSVTMIGGSTPVPEVKKAIDLADGAYVPLMELEERDCAISEGSAKHRL